MSITNIWISVYIVVEKIRIIDVRTSGKEEKKGEKKDIGNSRRKQELWNLANVDKKVEFWNAAGQGHNPLRALFVHY